MLVGVYELHGGRLGRAYGCGCALVLSAFATVGVFAPNNSLGQRGLALGGTVVSAWLAWRYWRLGLAATEVGVMRQRLLRDELVPWSLIARFDIGRGRTIVPTVTLHITLKTGRLISCQEVGAYPGAKSAWLDVAADTLESLRAEHASSERRQ